MIIPKLNFRSVLRSRPTSTGFTLIEIMVAVSIFVVVAMIATGAFITANRINQRAQALQRIMDNLNFALDDIAFKIQKGTDFSCGTTAGGAARCTDPVEAITFRYPKYGDTAGSLITISHQRIDGRGAAS